MTTIKITTVTGIEFTETGKLTYKYIDGEKIFYINGASYPAEIVEIIDGKELM